VFLGYDILYNQKWTDWANWGFIAGLIGLYAHRLTAARESEYESGRMEVLYQAVDVLSFPENYYVYDIVAKYFKTEYAFAFGAFLLLAGYQLLVRHKIWATLFILAATIGWVALNLVTYSYLKSDILIMIDGYLALLGFIWATPALFFLERAKFRSFSLGLLGALLLFSLYRIYDAHHFYAQRHVYIEDTLERHVTSEKRKFIVPGDHFEWEKMWYPYEIPHESLFLSSLKGPEHSATIFVNYEYRDTAQLKQDSSVFLQLYEPVPIDRHDGRYFQLPKNEYEIIEEVAWEED
ncbi:MAG: hypothetical protein R3350_07310, partial [Saprospiraceae bacterium]|nr:hypothetical protein [Saprospiraceae bacterium]